MSINKTKKYPVKLVAIEVTLYIATGAAWVATKELLKLNINDEYLIDFVFFVALVVLIFAKNKHPRLFWYGFFSVVFCAFTDALGASKITFFMSSFAISFLFLGILNTLLFNRDSLKD